MKISFVDKIIDFFTELINSIIDWGLELLNGLGLGIGSFIGEWLISLGMTIEIPSNVFAVLNDFTRGVGYILPLSSLTPIVTFMLSFYVIKIVFAVYKLIASTVIERVNIKM